MKKPWLLCVILTTLCGALLLPALAFATGEVVTVNPNPVVTVTGGASQAVVTGTFNAAVSSLLTGINNIDTLQVRYGVYTGSAVDESALTPVSCEIFDTTGINKDTGDTFASSPCPITLTASGGSFTAKLSNLTNGTYAFEAGVYDRQILGSNRWFPYTSIYTFTVSRTNTGKFSVTYGSAAVSGKDVAITVNVSNLLIAAQGYIQLGTAVQQGTTAKYTCIPGTLTSPAITINPTVGGAASAAVFHFTNLSDGNYCVRVQANVPGAGLVNAGDPGAIDGNGYFTAANALFSIGSASLVPGATNDPTANPTGCVTKSDNSNYCLLAPLPGVGDATGSLNVTSFSSYFLIIIKIVMGLIGVLSVLMITIGGIEYMTTVSIGEKEGAKSRITSALFGLLLALSSYVILNTINPKLVSLGVTIPNVTVTSGEDGGVESDETGTPPASIPTNTGISVPSGSAQDLAKQILASSSITLDGQWGQNDANSTPMQNIQDTANGKAASTSAAASSQLGGVKQNPLSMKMLAGMLAVSQATPITITAIEGSVHSGSGSKHYSGRAFDVQTDHSDAASSLALDKKIGDACTVAGASLVITPCAGAEGSGFCSATGYPTNTGHKTHVHCEWPS